MEMPFVQSFSCLAISYMQIPNQKLMQQPQKVGKKGRSQTPRAGTAQITWVDTRHVVTFKVGCRQAGRQLTEKLAVHNGFD